MDAWRPSWIRSSKRGTLRTDRELNDRMIQLDGLQRELDGRADESQRSRSERETRWHFERQEMQMDLDRKNMELERAEAESLQKFRKLERAEADLKRRELELRDKIQKENARVEEQEAVQQARVESFEIEQERQRVQMRMERDRWGVEFRECREQNSSQTGPNMKVGSPTPSTSSTRTHLLKTLDLVAPASQYLPGGRSRLGREEQVGNINNNGKSFPQRTPVQREAYWPDPPPVQREVHLGRKRPEIQDGRHAREYEDYISGRGISPRGRYVNRKGMPEGDGISARQGSRHGYRNHSDSRHHREEISIGSRAAEGQGYSTDPRSSEEEVEAPRIL